MNHDARTAALIDLPHVRHQIRLKVITEGFSKGEPNLTLEVLTEWVNKHIVPPALVRTPTKAADDSDSDSDDDDSLPRVKQGT